MCDVCVEVGETNCKVPAATCEMDTEMCVRNVLSCLRQAIIDLQRGIFHQVGVYYVRSMGDQRS
jgi:hypothetical protein